LRRETVMFALIARRASSIAPLAVGALLMGVVLTACGDDDGAVPAEATTVATTQPVGAADAGSTSGTGGSTAGDAGTATVTVSAGTFELDLDEACVISDVGIAAVASSDQATLYLAGPREVAVMGFGLSSGEQWSVAAAPVVIDGTTMSYSGPAMGPGADSTISVQVSCDEVVTGPGG